MGLNSSGCAVGRACNLYKIVKYRFDVDKGELEDNKKGNKLKKKKRKIGSFEKVHRADASLSLFPSNKLYRSNKFHFEFARSVSFSETS